MKYVPKSTGANTKVGRRVRLRNRENSHSNPIQLNYEAWRIKENDCIVEPVGRKQTGDSSYRFCYIFLFSIFHVKGVVIKIVILCLRRFFPSFFILIHIFIVSHFLLLFLYSYFYFSLFLKWKEKKETYWLYKINFFSLV